MIASLLAPEVHAAFDDAILLVGLIAGVVALFKFPYKSFVKWIRGKETASSHAAYVINTVIPTLVAAHDEMDVKFDFILQELKPNHGTSLRDAVNRIEAQTRKQEGMLRGFWSFDDRCIYIADASNSIEWANEALLDLCHVRSWDILGHGFWQLIDTDDRDRLEDEIAQARADRRGGHYDFHINTSVGKKHIVTKSSPLLDSASNLVGFVGMIREVRERGMLPERRDEQDDGKG